MKKLINYLRTHGQNPLMLLLAVLAVVFSGGSAMAMADAVQPQIGHEGADPLPKDETVNPSSSRDKSDPDPVDPKASDRQSPGGNHDGQNLDGTQASSSQINKGGLQEDEWDANIVKFHPYKNPLLSIARQVTHRQNISNWSVKHMRVGGEKLEAVTTADIAAGDTITLTPKNVSGSLRPFYKGSTILVEGVPGYKKGSQTIQENGLMLYVVDSDKNGVTCQAVNGPAKTEGEYGDELDYYTVPNIPSGTVLSCASVAASESQLMCPPENFQPREKEVYVQKKLLNIVFTDDYEKVKKRQPLKVQDIKADALEKYNMRAERTYWKGIKSRFNVTNKDGSVELAYTSEGILWQLTNLYAIDSDDIKLTDLTAISKLQFTDFSNSSVAYAFCGKDFMEKLLNVSSSNAAHRIVFTDTNNFNLDFKTFKTTFGTIHFIWDQTLDMLQMADCMVVLDLDNAVRYVKISEKEQTNDMSKGSGEIRDAKRFIHQEADAVALRGYNSVLVGPSDKILGLPSSKDHRFIVSVESIPKTPYEGMLISPKKDLTSGSDVTAVTLEAGNVYIYTNSKWEEYRGQVTAA